MIWLALALGFIAGAALVASVVAIALNAGGDPPERWAEPLRIRTIIDDHGYPLIGVLERHQDDEPSGGWQS